jgi:hypothetical protein
VQSTALSIKAVAAMHTKAVFIWCMELFHVCTSHDAKLANYICSFMLQVLQILNASSITQIVSSVPRTFKCVSTSRPTKETRRFEKRLCFIYLCLTAKEEEEIFPAIPRYF